MRSLLLFCSISLASSAAVYAQTLKDEDFRIAYETFIANGDLNEAYSLARRVSRKNPKDMAWQRRLARVSDWSNRPSVAYKAWKVLYRNTKNDKEVLKAIKRLSEYFNDAPIQLELLQAQIKAGKRPTPTDVDTLIAHFERAYRATEGARYLEMLYNKFRYPYLGKKAAELYIRTGHDDQALRMYRSLSKQNPKDRENLIATAKLEIRLNHHKEALALLKTYRVHAREDDFIYWQMLGDVAWMLQDDDTATFAYSRLSLSPAATAEERLRVFELLLQEDPEHAATLAVSFYRAGGSIAWLQRSLAIYVSRKQWRAASQVLGEAKREDYTQLQQSPRYLVLRAQVAAHFNRKEIAAHDMLHAIALDPENDELLISALWLFNDIGNRTKLQQLVSELPLSPPPAYWHVLAVSYQTLGSHARALAYYQRMLQRNPNNSTLLIEYADLLQQSGNAATAERIRRAVWQRLRSGRVNTADDRLQLVRLQLTEQPGDYAAQRARSLLDAKPSKNAISTQQRDELLLSWAIETGWRESAHSWALQRYTVQGEPLPKWAELHLALQTNDHVSLQALLAEGGNDLPTESAYDAAMMLGRWPLARSLAFDGLQQNPNSTELHQRFYNLSRQHADRLTVGLRSAHYDTLDSSGYQLALEQALSKRIRLGIQWRSSQQSLNNLDTLRELPSSDTGATLLSRFQTTDQDWQLAITAYDELTRYTGWSLSTTQQFDRRIQWNASLAAKQPVDYTAPLQVAAHTDYASLGLSYTIEQHLRLGINLVQENYHTQHDASLGSGSRLNWELSYSILNNYPDWNVRLSADHYRFTADGTPDTQSLALLDPGTVAATAPDRLAELFVPADDNYYALCSGAGNAVRETGSHTLRPFIDLCAIYSDNYGESYNMVLGISTSIDNRDSFNLTLEQSNASLQAENRNTQILNFNYQLIF